MNSARIPPGRKQYLEIKRQYPDALLLFRVGDFYETFDEDAKTMAKVVDIALTSRDVGGGERSPLAGIPHHALDTYLSRLIKHGLKVAVADQVSDPSETRGLVERKVVRIVTPGTVLDEKMLNPDRNNYLAAVVVNGDVAGLAYVDLTTASFTTSQIQLEQLSGELEGLTPSEVIVDEQAKAFLSDTDYLLRPAAPQDCDTALAERNLKQHLGVADLEAFGCKDYPQAILAAFLVLQYVKETQQGSTPQLKQLQTLLPDEYVRIDANALKDLEIFNPSGTTDKEAPTLFSVLNLCNTSIGARLLRHWIMHPLKKLDQIETRQNLVEALIENGTSLRRITEALKKVGDLERLMSRVQNGLASPRDLVQMSTSLQQVPLIRAELQERGALFKDAVAQIEGLGEPVHLIQEVLAPDPPPVLGNGRTIKEGYSRELDELKTLATDARAKLLELETRERNATGIRSLKTGNNKIFGYYIEVSRSNLGKVPAYFERKQTLAGAERFVTRELKELEVRILGARERLNELERTIFSGLCQDLAAYSDKVLSVAEKLAELDVLCSYAQCAIAGDWVRPVVDAGRDISIKKGRHPIVEAAMRSREFVPNDVQMSSNDEQLLIITGPNMSGKSTFIRMVAVLTLLAQIGSFIPASEARVGLTDRIFTRTGLSDDISGGRSTFMVEMVETAAILNQATGQSLAVLDEIGRGTSTYDGLALAQAIAEYVHNAPQLGCRTLFATHYHEMAELEKRLKRVKNYHVAVAEEGRKVHFLRQIVEGSADRSYGVYVAQLAGMPPEVLSRAWQLLERFERSEGNNAYDSREIQLSMMDYQNAVRQPASPNLHNLLEEVSKLDLDGMTPLEALVKLSELKHIANSNGA